MAPGVARPEGGLKDGGGLREASEGREAAPGDAFAARIESLERRVAALENRGGPRFVPPTVSEVGAYVREKGYSINPAHFVAYYAARGWKLGAQPMRNWKATVVTWEHRNREQAGGPKPPATKYPNTERKR